MKQNRLGEHRDENCDCRRAGPRGLAEEVALGREFQARGNASAKALRQPCPLHEGRDHILLSSLSFQHLAQCT